MKLFCVAFVAMKKELEMRSKTKLNLLNGLSYYRGCAWEVITNIPKYEMERPIATISGETLKTF